jgi:enoyl-CoA hydratase
VSGVAIRWYDRLETLPVVTIAEIEGCLLPGAGGTQRLTRLCGEGIAARIILSGDVVGGREAGRIGLVQWAFEAADFGRSAAEIVSRTAGLSPDARKLAKNCIRLAVPEQTRGGQAEIEGIRTLMRSDETSKRVHGFLRN